MYKNKYIKLIGSPKIFSFLVIWMMVLVFVGTLVQKDIGLYAKPSISISIFEKIVEPILLYNSEITAPFMPNNTHHP